MDEIRDSLARPVPAVSPIVPPRPHRELEAFARPEGPTTAERDRVSLSADARSAEIREVMNREVVTIESRRTLAELSALLRQHGISGVPVVDNEVLVGVVTQADLARHLAGLGPPEERQASYHLGLAFDIALPLQTSSTTRVAEIMTPFIYFATEDASVAQVLDVMLRHRIHRVVITRERRLVGLVTSMDLLQLYRQQLGD